LREVVASNVRTDGLDSIGDEYGKETAKCEIAG
jgi:hypothetical protein